MTEKQHDAVEYLQIAAIEAIKAMRAFLDVAEGLVREPETAAVVGKAFAQAASSAFRPSTLVGDDTADDDDDRDDRDEGAEHHTGVRRIDLSD